jgi:hypothetical protein
MLTVLWDSQGVLLVHLQKRGGNVNSASYCEVLLKLRDAIRRKRPGQLARGVLLHHDNARPHTAQATQERIQELQWELVEHPHYSPDLVSSVSMLVEDMSRNKWFFQARISHVLRLYPFVNHLLTTPHICSYDLQVFSKFDYQSKPSHSIT